MIRLILFPDIMPVSAVTGEGLYQALDWLCLKLGSTQARRAIAAPAEEENAQNGETSKNETETAAPETVDLQARRDYCSRAYSAIKCFFFRSNRQGGQESPDTLSTSSQEKQ